MVINKIKIYQKINILKNQMNISDDLHRELIARQDGRLVAGRHSLKGLNERQLLQVMAHYQAFAKQHLDQIEYEKHPEHWPINTKCGTWREGSKKKIVRLWNELANDGRLQDRSLAACRRWCAVQTGINDLDWYLEKHFHKCIEMLKKWIAR